MNSIKSDDEGKRMYKIIGSDQKQYGPVRADQLRQWIAEGRINAQTLVQAEGQTDWRPLSSYPEFATAAAPAPIPAMPPVGNAAALVSGPATGLLIVGILSAAAAVSRIAGSLFGWAAFGMARGRGGIPPQLQHFVEMMSGGLGIFLGVLGLAVSAFVIYGAVKMRKLESYGMVMAATIVSMVPGLSPCCCVGLPIGVWILVVLSKPEVKSAFH